MAAASEQRRSVRSISRLTPLRRPRCHLAHDLALQATRRANRKLNATSGCRSVRGLAKPAQFYSSSPCSQVQAYSL